MNNFWLVGWIVILLYFILETEAIPHWGNVLGMKFLRYNKFKEQSKLFGTLKYRQFILGQYQNFLVALVTCQECLGTWFTLIAYLVSPRTFGGWETFGWTLIGVIVGIAAFKSLLRRLYE